MTYNLTVSLKDEDGEPIRLHPDMVVYPEDNGWTVIDNRSGEAFTEHFNNLIAARAYMEEE